MRDQEERNRQIAVLRRFAELNPDPGGKGYTLGQVDNLLAGQVLYGAEQMANIEAAVRRLESGAAR